MSKAKFTWWIITGKILGEGIVEKILKKANKTHIARVKSYDVHGEELNNVRGFVAKSKLSRTGENEENLLPKGRTCMFAIAMM
jgi:hypothetical protein